MARVDLISGIQVISGLFGLGMLYSSYADFRRRRFGKIGLAFWGGLWLGLVAVSLFPAIFQPLTRPFRARLMDIVIVLGMLTFGAILYRVYVQLGATRRLLEELVRQDALAQVERV